MQTIKHPQQTHDWGAPPNWEAAAPNGQTCGGLSAQRKPYGHTHMDESCWKPSMGEALSQAVGLSHVRLQVIGQPQHPPVGLCTYPVKTPDLPELAQRFQEAHQFLIEMAESHGLVLTAERTCDVHGKRKTVTAVRTVREVYSCN